MTKDELILYNRFKELASIADVQNRCTFSRFLNLNEYQVFLSTINEISYVDYCLWGGYKEAERRIVVFFPKGFSREIQYPCSCLKISPLQAKFSDQLTHRDYLGAILNLGIDRSMIGDIVIQNPDAYLFCEDTIASFIVSECTRIKHTTIQVCETSLMEISDFTKSFLEKTGFIASFRLDALVAFACGYSRSESAKRIKEGLVYCNHKQILSPSFELKPDTIFSVKGVGRFLFPSQEMKTSKKGRLYIKIQEYK